MTHTHSTFLELVNRVCERLNEEKITESEFPSVVGIHASIKNAVRDGVTTLLQQEAKWPFAAIEHSIKLDNGTEEYAWPENFDTVDWNSFFIYNDYDNSLYGSPLGVIQTEEWQQRGRRPGSINLPKGTGLPRYVFATHGNGFGLSPNPDQEYVLRYRYWRIPKILENFDDEVPIPRQFEHVVMSVSLMIMYSFLDNTERATFWENRYNIELKSMKRTLLSRNLHSVHDRRVNY